MTIANQIAFSMFELNKDTFSMNDIYNAIPGKPKTTIRARIYENLGKKFERVARGIYRVINIDSEVLLIEGDGRNLSFLPDESVDLLVNDHPWSDTKSNKGGNRNFCAGYDEEVFRYTLNDFKEKFRVLKEHHALIEIIPAENANNFEYLYTIKKLALESGFSYYAKVDWKKVGFVSNTGRKAKNTEEILIFSKGVFRSLRRDEKKIKQTGELHYMSGTNGILPTQFEYEPVKRNEKIHQSEKPVKLYESLLDFFSLEGELVVDQYCGSGSVGAACINKKRNCILIEKLHDNIVKIVERLNLNKLNLIDLNN